MRLLLRYEQDETAPVVCQASVEEAERQSADMCRLLDDATEIAPTVDGVRISVEDTDHHREELTSWIERERQCCPFLAFRLRSDAGSLTLELGSDADGNEWVQTLLER